MAVTLDVVEVETEWIPLSDGRRLAARLFLPAEAAGPSPQRVPVVLEYLPYRRRDGTRLGDEAMYRWFAARGIAGARVDIAGTGDSDGLLEDEYVAREQDDGVEVIEWLATQPWCSGAVGMIGISWGGFNGLQLAARRPPALRAVISACSTVDRYDCDAHYSGGCLNEENLEWGTYLLAMHAMPPDPAVVGDRWEEMWRQRIQAAPLPPAEWLRHQRRDAFWRHGSVVEDPGAIDVPVLAVSGWADGYTRTVLDIVEHLGPPSQGIIGPWGHLYPHVGVPGPAIGFLQVALEWWRRWLCEPPHRLQQDDVGVVPGRVALWVQRPVRPLPHHDRRDGCWVVFDEWPPPQVGQQRWWLSGTRLVPEAHTAGGDVAAVSSPVTTGLAGGQWCAYGLGRVAPELPGDQRSDDAGSFVARSEPLAAPAVLVGRPRVALRLSADGPDGFVAVRLLDIHPDGSSERISYGILNLAHRHGPEEPEAPEAGEVVDVTLLLDPLGHHLEADHRLGVAISTSYWPMIWPSPRPVSVELHLDDCWIETDVVDPAYIDAESSRWTPPPAEAATAGRVTVHSPPAQVRRIERDPMGCTEVYVERDDGRYTLDDIGTTQTFRRRRRTTIHDGDPASARAVIDIETTYERGEWRVEISASSELSSTATAFRISGRLAAASGGVRFAERTFEEEIPRDHM